MQSPRRGVEERGGRKVPRVHGKAQQALREAVNLDNLHAMKATLPEPEIVTRKRKPVSVIIPIKDSDDMAWLKRARKEPLQHRPLEDYLAKRNRK